MTGAQLVWKNMTNLLKTKLSDLAFVAFDTETTGAYPVGDEIVEFGAVKWSRGQIVETLQVLVKPSQQMTAFNIGIHGITNEMVETCPSIGQEIQKIRDFIGDATLIAHHAPFDMGFMAIEFEKFKILFPRDPVLCTSLLARKLIPESSNHKLQTLIKFLNIDGGQAHRALDDAKACLMVALECFKRMGPEADLEQAVRVMQKKLQWADYYLLNNPSNLIQILARVILEKGDFQFVYDGGSLKGKTRVMTPKGIVRNPDGDYVSAICHLDRVQKRFYLAKILDYSAL